MRQFCSHIILGSGYFGLPLMSFSKSSFITTSQAICNLFLTESIHLVSSDTLSLSLCLGFGHIALLNLILEFTEVSQREVPHDKLGCKMRDSVGESD